MAEALGRKQRKGSEVGDDRRGPPVSRARWGVGRCRAWLRAEPGKRWAAVACDAGPQRTRVRVGVCVLGRARGAGPDGRAQVRVGERCCGRGCAGPQAELGPEALLLFPSLA